MFHQSGFRAKIRPVGQFDSQFSAITVLRLLSWLETDRQYRDIVLNMEDHDEERREHQTITWNLQKHLIVDFIQNLAQKCAGSPKPALAHYSEDYIRKVTGILMTNTTSLQLREAGLGVGLYPLYAMGNHSCLPNTRTVVRPDRVLELVALTTVRAGEEVTSGYITAQAGTVERRKTLWENWFFHCSCSR